MKWLRPIITVTTVLALSGLAACLEETPQELTTPQVTIPVPTSLAAVLGSNQVTLSWNADASFTYSGFAVYRSENGTTWERLGEVTVSPYIDSTVRPNVLYDYQVAGIDVNQVESARSAAITVRASVFSVLINGDAEFTKRRDVSLAFFAPAGTELVRFSEDPAFTGAVWIDFVGGANLTLSSGDAIKVVFVEFNDDQGFTSEVITDSITLDTQALVQSASFAPTPASPATTIHFIVTPLGTELNGQASVRVSGYGPSISARDDGSNGDATANDGVYEVDFVVPSTLRGTNLRVTTTFTDAAGNTSPEFEFANRLDITDPPTAVNLLLPQDSTTTSVSLRWSESDEDNFRRYEVFRDTDAGVSRTNSPRATTTTQKTVVTYTDNNLDEGQTYYYIVYVVNDLDEFVGSNVRIAHTQDNPPTAVVLDSVSAVGPTRLTLTWSRNENSDFDRYEIYRQTSPGVTGSPATLVVTITDRFTTFFDDSGIDTQSNTYYYRVFVVDKGELSTRSNEVSSP